MTYLTSGLDTQQWCLDIHSSGVMEFISQYVIKTLNQSLDTSMQMFSSEIWFP